jgi:hypothetical protein
MGVHSRPRVTICRSTQVLTYSIVLERKLSDISIRPPPYIHIHEHSAPQKVGLWVAWLCQNAWGLLKCRMESRAGSDQLLDNMWHLH